MDRPATTMRLTAATALLGGFLYGFTLAVIAGVEPFVAERFDLGAGQIGFVVSNLDLGAALGALLAGPLSDRFGRKKALVAVAAGFAISTLLTTAATTVAVLLAGRFLAGLAVGASMVVPLYVAEIAPAARRGVLVTLVQIGIVTGIFLAYVTDWLAVGWGPSNWRYMFGAGLVPAVAFLGVVSILPESPRWVARRDASATEASAMAGLLRPGVRRALRAGLVLAILSVAVGINAVLMYGPLILTRGGHGLEESLRAMMLIGAVNFAFSFAAMALIDRLGRKALLVGGLAGMVASMALLGRVFRPATSNGPPWVLAPILSFVLCYAVSLGPVTWVLLAEIFPTRVRGAAMTVCTVVMYLADFGVTFLFPWLVDALGSGAFYIFAGTCVAGIVFVAAAIPETRGRALEEIEALWTGAPPKENLR
jgi:SP family arabinose:H+ symporter-like MFS transporter